MEWGSKRKESPKVWVKTGTADVREPHMSVLTVVT